MLPLVSHVANLFNLCPFPDSPALYVQNLFAIGPAVWPHFPGLWMVEPLNPPPNAAVGYRGANCFSICPFPDESTDVYRIWCLSVHPFDSFPRLKFVTRKKTRNAPCDIGKRIIFIYVHSQTNPQTCTKFGANLSSHLTASPDIWICDPLTPPPQCPWGIVGRLVFSLWPFPDKSADVNQSWCKSVKPFDSFSRLLNVWPPKTPQKCPLGYWGRIVFSLCPFPDESADVYQIRCQSVQPFDSFPRLLNVWPPTPPPNAPWGIQGRLWFSLCPFPDESADVNQS